MRGFRRGSHRTDGPQKEIVAALRKVTVVENLSQASTAGAPDLVARRVGGPPPWGVPIWLEVKAPGGKLSPAQLEFQARWPSYYYVVTSVEEALRAVGVTVVK